MRTDVEIFGDYLAKKFPRIGKLFDDDPESFRKQVATQIGEKPSKLATMGDSAWEGLKAVCIASVASWLDRRGCYVHAFWLYCH